MIDIRDYGAKSGEKCTEAIQRAIDMCGKGDTVCIPEGEYICGALWLKSDMTLRLEKGARLVGSGKVEDFPVIGCPFEGLMQLCYASLINTNGAPCKNITIEGEGVIDANGKPLFKPELSDDRIKRGRAVCIRNTDGVVIRGVSIRQSPSWCLHLIYCNDVLIENIEVHTKYNEQGEKYGMYNGDGIDIDSCRDVVVRRSLIASQDDGIAVKSGRDAEGRRVGIPSQNVLIEDCDFVSGFGAAIGSEMAGGVSDVTVRNCRFTDTHSIASIKPIRGRGAYVKNIRYENCTLKNHSTEFGDTKWFRGAIYLDGFYGVDDPDIKTPAPIDDGTPVVDGIVFKDITLETSAGNAVYLCGLPERLFKNVRFENVKAKGKTASVIENIEGLELIDTEISGE